jgi:L-2-hydroxyglutarate oxidase LhgO
VSNYDCVVIGGGLIGVACANVIARGGRSVAVIERNRRPGMETSSRNSGVIHAGLYYPPGSLKAVACTEGRHLLYRRCEALGLPHRRTGKLVVATNSEEQGQLEFLAQRARSNGAGEVALLTQMQTRALEPHVSAVGALLSPESGIVDVHELLYSHKKEALDAGADFSFETSVEGLERQGSEWKVSCRARGDQRFLVTTPVVVNAAGLSANHVAQMVGVPLEAAHFVYHYAKGDYFSLSARHRGRVRRLVYPVPSQVGLGIHLTMDLSGALTAGPDAEYVGELKYSVDESKRAQFADALRRYYPDISADELSPAYSGIRPKLQGPGEAFRDFVLEDMTDWGAPGVVALLGIESPGVTASEFLAQRTNALVRSHY